MTLNDMVNNQGLRVFINCTAGVSRGPTLLVVYLALFIKHKNWKDIDAIYQFVEDQYRW